MMSNGRIAWVLIALSTLGCGDDVSAPRDHGVADMGNPSGPRPPEAPRWDDCPTGWAPDESGACRAFGDLAELPTCGAGEGLFPSLGPECVRVGPACPAGRFAEPPSDAMALLYVDSEAPPGGAGSEISPLTNLTDAVVRAEPGTVILLSKGVHEVSNALITDGVMVLGACSAETIVRRPTESMFSVLASNGPGVTVAQLTIADSPHAGFVVAGTEGATATLRDVIIERVTGFGVVAGRGGRLEAERLVVRDVEPRADGTIGYGVTAVEQDDALSLRTASVRRAHTTGVAVVQAGASLEDVLIDEIALNEDTGAGAAMVIDRGPVSVHGSVLRRSVGVTIQALGDGTVLEMADCRLEQKLRAPMRGAMLAVGGGATATLDRVAMVDSAEEAQVVVGGFRTQLVLNDVWLAGGGTAILAQEASAVELHRASITDQRRYGVVVHGADTRVDAFDVQVTDVREDVGGEAGVGVVCADGSLTVERLAVERVQHVGLQAYGDAAVTATDVRVSETLPGADEVEGWGITASRGAQLQLTDVVVEGAHETGLQVRDVGTHVTGTGVRISSTGERLCSGERCPADPGGMGIGVYDGARLSLDDFEVRAAAFCGVHLAGEPELELTGGLVAECDIGACVHDVGYPTEPVTVGVVYEGNDLPLDTAGPPVPPAVPRPTLPGE